MKSKEINNKEIKSEKVKIKRIVLYILLIVVLLSIFMFSGETGTKSNNTSDKFTSSIIDKVSSVTNKDISENKKKDLIINMRFMIRKTAHFTIYFVLGIIIYLLLKTYNIKNIVLISIIICFIFGGLDEIHQIFIPGRSASFYDTLIDTLGSSVSILLLNIYNVIKNKNKNNSSKIVNVSK